MECQQVPPPICKTPPARTDEEFADAFAELTEVGEEELELPTTKRSGWCKPVDNIDQGQHLQPEDFAVYDILSLLRGATDFKTDFK